MQLRSRIIPRSNESVVPLTDLVESLSPVFTKPVQSQPLLSVLEPENTPPVKTIELGITSHHLFVIWLCLSSIVFYSAGSIREALTAPIILTEGLFLLLLVILPAVVENMPYDDRSDSQQNYEL